MLGSTDGSGKPEVSWETEGLTPDAGPEGARSTPNGVENGSGETDWMSMATEDPAWSLKELGSG